MTMPHQGSRLIQVGDTVYRWRIRKKPTFTQATTCSPMKLAVQSCSDGAGSVLVVELSISRPDNWVDPHQTAVKPWMVQRIVTEALASGWDPMTARPHNYRYGLIKHSV